MLVIAQASDSSRNDHFLRSFVCFIWRAAPSKSLRRRELISYSGRDGESLEVGNLETDDARDDDDDYWRWQNISSHHLLSRASTRIMQDGTRQSTTGRCVSVLREGIPTRAPADRHLVDTGRFCGLRLHVVHEMEQLLSNQYNSND